MTSDLTMIATDASKAVAALPVIAGAIPQFQGHLSHDEHKSVLQQTTTMLGVAAQSVQALGNAGVIGRSDAASIEEGADIVGSAVGVIAEIEALAVRLKSLLKHVI